MTTEINLEFDDNSIDSIDGSSEPESDLVGNIETHSHGSYKDSAKVLAQLYSLVSKHAQPYTDSERARIRHRSKKHMEENSMDPAAVETWPKTLCIGFKDEQWVLQKCPHPEIGWLSLETSFVSRD